MPSHWLANVRGVFAQHGGVPIPDIGRIGTINFRGLTVSYNAATDVLDVGTESIGNVIRDQTITVAPITATAEYHNCTISVNINVATAAKFRGCTFSSSIAVTAPTINIDNESLRSLVAGGGTMTGTVTGFAGQVYEWGANAATNGQYLLPGVREANPTTTVAQDAAKNTLPRAGVFLNFRAFASSSTSLTFMKNQVATALVLSPSNSIVTNTSQRIFVAAGDDVGVRVTGSSTNVLVVCEFV